MACASYELSQLDQHDHLHQSFELKNISTFAQKHDGAASAEESDSDEEEKLVASRSGRRASDSSVQSFMLYTPDEEQAVLRKLDRRLVSFMALLYMLSFLDRSNIGNARIAGLSDDLQLSSSQYEWLLTSFYIAYILFEWMTLLYRIFPPHIYIALCVASWGLIASLQAISFSFSFLCALRVLLGISEAAFGPGVPFYLSFFFKREELALRTGLFISAAPFATSFASTLAWAITKIGTYIPIAPWRILFLVEGFPSVIVAVFAWYYIPDSPETAVYLSSREKKVAKLRLRKKTHVAGQAGRRGLNCGEIWQTLMDPKCYLTAAMFFCSNVAFSSLPVFLPTIIKEMGYSALTSQALSAPPYLVAFIAVLLTAYFSDRHRTRSIYICFHALLATFGYLIIAIAGSLHARAAWRYAGIYPAAAGFFSAITIIITWTINNQDSDSKKGTGVAMLNIIGQMGPLVGTRLYPDRDAPYYVKGMAVCAGFMFGVGVLALGLRVYLARKNRGIEIAYEAVKDEEEGEYGGKEMEKFVFML